MIKCWNKKIDFDIDKADRIKEYLIERNRTSM